MAADAHLMGAALREWFSGRSRLWDQMFLVLAAAAVRFWRLEVPDALVFDEVYFAVMANNYIEQVSFFDSHPPLGKYLIALGIKLFGFTPFGYRCVDALFGIGVIIMIYRLGTHLFSDRRIGLAAGVLALLDGVLLVESRAGLINIFAVFFNLAAYYLFFLSVSGSGKKPQWVYLIASGICIGAGIAVKWISVATLGLIPAIYIGALLLKHLPHLRRIVPYTDTVERMASIHPDRFIVTCLFVPVVVYGASFIIHLNQIPDYQFFELQRQIWGYHSGLKATHSYGSPWWSWPILKRPVSYYHYFNPDKQTVMTILNIGNPLLWWAAIPAFLFGSWTAVVRRHPGALFVLAAIIVHYLPFSLISRVSYLYHFMGALPFTILFLGFLLVRFWDSGGWRRETAFAVSALILVAAVYFFPIWTAIEIPVGAYYARMWFTQWI